MSVDNSTNPPKCIQCSLINNNPSSHSAINSEDIYQLTTFLFPGVFFCMIAFRWSMLLVYKWSMAAKSQQLELLGLPLPPLSAPASSSCLQQLGARQIPWEGLVKIVMATLTTIITISLPSLSSSIIIIISMYAFFLISGIVDVFVFYCGYSVIPEGIQSFILAVSFFVEATCFNTISTAENSYFIHLLVIIILCCSISSILEIVFDNRLVKFCRTFFTLLQSSWLLHLSFLLSQDTLVSHLWTTILFTWHLGFLFLFVLLILLLTSHCSSPVPSPPLLPSISNRQVSPSGSASQLVPCKILNLPLGPSNHEGVLANSQTMFHTMYKTERLKQMRAPSVVDVEPWDRVHKIQYTTFQNR